MGKNEVSMMRGVAGLSTVSLCSSQSHVIELKVVDLQDVHKSYGAIFDVSLVLLSIADQRSVACAFARLVDCRPSGWQGRE